MTRQAYGLTGVTQREFPAETTVDAADPANNQATLQNIRLWDWRALQDTLRQIQEIRTYYDFPDIDIDRYEIDGTTREVMLAARELNVEKLPESSRNWINEKLIYTHGYGITMNPVNGFTPEGLPTLMLSNMPVQSTVPGLNVTRPEIYFGELTNTDVYVKTRQKEFNYPQGETNNLTSYEGNGGIVIGGFLRRILHRVRPRRPRQAAVQRRHEPREPAADAAQRARSRLGAGAVSHLRSRIPTSCVGDDGRLSWMMDAFTTSDSYPYSTHYRARRRCRSITCATASRWSSTPTMARQRFTSSTRRTRSSPPTAASFPSLFKDASAMPAGPAQARALSRVAAQAAGGSLRPLSHDGSGGVLQPRGSVDGRHRSRHGRGGRASHPAHAAEFRADETARRNRTSSSSRFCPSRPPTAIT